MSNEIIRNRENMLASMQRFTYLKEGDYMSNEISRNQENILVSMQHFINYFNLQDAKIISNSKNGTATISGNHNGMQYTTTIKKYDYGVVETKSEFKISAGKEVLINQIKELKSQGYKQIEIANMLGVSQSLVSKYLK